MKNQNYSEIGIGKYSWSYIIKWLIIIMIIYALFGWLLVSHPFAFYTVRGSSLNYSRIFYLHGLTVGFAGITGLMVSQAFNLSPTIKKIIFYLTIACVLIGLTGGAINRSMEHKITLWYQILSMFSLDITLLSLVIGFLILKNQLLRRTKAYWIAFLASVSALIAGLFGDLVGFILDFGNWPGICGWYANKIGYTLSEWQDALLRTHSDMMVVSVLSLLIAIANYRFGSNLIGKAKIIRNFGEWLLIIGIILTLIIYIVSGLGGSSVQIPHLFTEKGFFEPRGQSVAGVDLGDFVIGVFTFTGAILITGASSFGKRNPDHKLTKTETYTIRGIFMAMVCIFLAVGGLGFLEEYRADLYNSDVTTTPLGNYGFIFRLLHVDVCLLLFPAMILLMLLAERSLKTKANRIFQIILRIGIVITFIGALIFMLVNYHSFGPGTWILALGIIILLCGIIYYLIHDQQKLRK
ncbi:hypothetical protein LMB83_09960 [Limosilactobacillus reuteri]|uniref:hypothetical protein n=1 Tax=Limosilactobacillus reuteri TaxID=1598 RepID=UPI001E2B2264|nr:hypothetical protein [Limosilactobacillus reuteri]MCC4412350.1 hypothetical protein [Limosilactobacillus reuteri]